MWGSGLIAQAQAVRINEVLPMVHPADSGWVELFNADTVPVDLHGMLLVREPFRVVLQEQPLLPPGRHRMVVVRGRSDGEGALMHLPAAGGDLLLFGADGRRMLDAFRWPSVPPGVSIGRLPDGAGTWSFLTDPGPEAPNRAAQPIRGRAPAPVAQRTMGGLVLNACNGCTVTCTTDGSPPSPGHGTVVTGPMALPENRTVRAVAWRADLLASAETWVQGQKAPGSGASLCINPPELFDPRRGLMIEGDRANHVRTGPAWVRPAKVALPGMVDTAASAVRLRLSGSGSRGLPKRSFNLSATDGTRSLPLPDGSTWRNVVLRADATPHALLRNLFAEVSVHRAGDRLDVQPGTPLPLTLNGVPQGTYRLMPAKNEDFLLSLTEAEHLDIVEGPEGRVVKGDRAPYERALDLLARRAPLDSLEVFIDLGSLIELACFDLWSGRADHDLNMRCWRPAQPGGRWRWVLYDMDLWAPPEDPSASRIAQAPLPAAPYLSALLDHPQLRPLLLARTATLLATVLAPAPAAALADSLFAAHAALMRADHALWHRRMAMPTPEESHADLRVHALRRPGHLLRHLARFTGTSLGTVSVLVPENAQGTVLLDGIVLPPGRHSITGFAGAPLRLEALPAPGMRLLGWEGCREDAAGAWADPAGDRKVRPLLMPVVSDGDGL